MKLAMAIGSNRHYVVHTVVGRHFVQTAKICGLPDKMVREVIQELVDTATSSVDQTLSHLPKGFPKAIAASISRGAKQRLKSLTQDRR
jgi:serine/threonine-protein kinase HipA